MSLNNCTSGQFSVSLLFAMWFSKCFHPCSTPFLLSSLFSTSLKVRDTWLCMFVWECKSHYGSPSEVSYDINLSDFNLTAIPPESSTGLGLQGPNHRWSERPGKFEGDGVELGASYSSEENRKLYPFVRRIEENHGLFQSPTAKYCFLFLSLPSRSWKERSDTGRRQAFYKVQRRLWVRAGY